MEIPLSVTLTGTAVGLIGSVLFPWPWPRLATALTPLFTSIPGLTIPPVRGLYPWPVWYPLPDWLPAGSPQLGLATGLAGIAVGTAVPRVIGFLFKAGRGKEGMGIGDADLMMMVGAFLGWQVVIVAFFAAVPMALIIGVVQLIVRGNKPMPFGPALAAGSVVSWLCWGRLPREVQALFFEPVLLGALAIGGSVLLFAISGLLRLIRGTDEPAGEEENSVKPEGGPPEPPAPQEGQ
jgi:leader peptidase (prepilin peptidase) / N-methyltransferase